MQRFALRSVMLITIFGLIGCAVPSSQAVLEEALDLLEKTHINASKVDWKAIRKDANDLQDRRNARTAIYFAIEQLDEKHTFYLPANAPQLKSMVNTNVSAFEPVIAAATGRLDRSVAVLPVPMFIFQHDHPATDIFIKKLGEEIARLAKSEPKAWIVDLRENAGGNMWPMLAGLACFFEPDILGYLRDSKGADMVWRIERNNVSVVGMQVGNDFTDIAQQNIPCTGALTNQNMAVLVGSKTSSSGEAVAISFLARANTMLIGETSAGFATGNSLTKLKDGSMIAVTTTKMLDKSGREFPHGIQPHTLGERGYHVKASEDALEVAISTLLEKNR
jgi:carboxyl-terminal processing protease